MKKLFFLFFCFLSFSSFSHHIGEPGNVVINDNNTDDHGLSAIFSLPIRIFEDGTVGFSWRTNTEVTTEPTDRVPTEPPRRREEINWYISPLVYVKLEKFKYFLNLEDHSLNKAITLEEGNSRAGYMVCEKNEFDFGIGAGFFTGKDFIVGGGLIPIFGGLVYSERFAPDFETAKSLKKVVFPKNAEGFKNWNKGDIIVYTKKAGINFYASASYFGPSVGVGFAAYGNWKVTLKKTGKNKIMASATKIDLESLTVYAGIQVANVNVSTFGSRDKAFSYEFSLDSKSGLSALEDFLSGSFKFTQRFVNQELVEGVTQLTESQTQSKGKILGVTVGIPILGTLDFVKGIVNSFSETHQLKNNEKLENTMSVYSRMVETSGVASKGLRKISLFSASHQEKVFPKREKSFVTANFKYFFSQKKMDSKTFQEGVSELKRITGLWDTLEFNLPEHKLGYAKIEFDAMISSKGTKQLLASNLEGTSVESIQEKIENYFDHESSPAKVCGFYRKVKFCKAHILSTTSQALGKMGKKIEEMKKWYSQKNWKKYTESFAEFGQEAITNQFTFNTFLKMLGKDNFKMQFKISGEKLKVLSINNFEENLSLN